MATMAKYIFIGPCPRLHAGTAKPSSVPASIPYIAIKRGGPVKSPSGLTVHTATQLFWADYRLSQIAFTAGVLAAGASFDR